jgi:uncharacterized protein YbjT (DUF2867 family)
MILITGATGNIGPPTVAQLTKSGTDMRVFALQDDPALDRLPDGVDTVYGDLFDPDTLDAALDGVDTVFLMWPFFALNVEDAPTIVAKIAKTAQRVVFISSIGVHLGLERRGNNCHAYLEELIEDTDLEWTFLRTTGFACNAAMSWREQIRTTGVVRSPYGDAARSPIHEDDVAAVAVRVMTSDGHGRQKYVLTGPQALTQIDQLRMIGTAIGVDLTWQDVPHDEAKNYMVSAGWPPAYADGALDYFAMLVREPELVTSTVADVLGRPPRAFQDWVTERAGDFR